MVASRRRLGFVGLLSAVSFLLALPAPAAAAAFVAPGAPTSLAARITSSSDYVHGTATISWRAPADTGGAPIDYYTVTVLGGPHNAGNKTSFSIGGFVLGSPKSYQITVSATGPGGTGPGVTIYFNPIFRPTPPLNLGAMYMSVSGGKANIQIGWDVPVNNGHSEITGYTATASPANKSCSVPSGNHNCTIALPLGTHQVVVVVAKNAYGSSLASASVSFTVPNVPGAPTGLMATITSWHDGKATVDLEWTAPVSSGGRPILEYDATLGNNLLSCTSTGVTKCEINGVAPGDYTPKVTAKNVIGSSAAATTTFTVPTAPPATPSPTATPTPAPTPEETPSAEPTDNGDQSTASDSGDNTPAGPTDQGGGGGIDPLLALVGMLGAVGIGVGATLIFLRLRGGMSTGGLTGPGGPGADMA